MPQHPHLAEAIAATQNLLRTPSARSADDPATQQAQHNAERALEHLQETSITLLRGAADQHLFLTQRVHRCAVHDPPCLHQNQDTQTNILYLISRKDGNLNAIIHPAQREGQFQQDPLTITPQQLTLALTETHLIKGTQ